MVYGIDLYVDTRIQQRFGLWNPPSCGPEDQNVASLCLCGLRSPSLELSWHRTQRLLGGAEVAPNHAPIKPLIPAQGGRERVRGTEYGILIRLGY